MSSLREINAKNCRCYCPDHKINIKDLDLDKILVFEKPGHKNVIDRFCNTKPHKLKKHLVLDLMQ